MTSLSAIGVIWIISLVISIPYIQVSVTTQEVYRNGESIELCIYSWPDGIVSRSQLEFMWVHSHMLRLTFTQIPLLIWRALCCCRSGCPTNLLPLIKLLKEFPFTRCLSCLCTRHDIWSSSRKAPSCVRLLVRVGVSVCVLLVYTLLLRSFVTISRSREDPEASEK